MRYFLVEGFLNREIIFDEEFQKILTIHMDYYENGIKKGFILINGPKIDGGMIAIAKAEQGEEFILKYFLENDPLNKSSYIKYEVKEFTIASAAEMIKDWVL